MKKGLKEQYLITELKEAIIAEKTAGAFYNYVSRCILRSKERDEFKKFAEEEAVEHKDLLNDRLKEITGNTFEPDLSKIDINIKASEFSLAGAFKMAKDSEWRAVKFYRRAKKRDKTEYRDMYDKILKDEKKHWSYLNKERKFARKQTQFRDVDGLRLYSFLNDCFK